MYAESLESELIEELTKVVACGNSFSDADARSSNWDDEHLVVALNIKQTEFLNSLPVRWCKQKMCSSVPVCRSRTEKLWWTR